MPRRITELSEDELPELIADATAAGIYRAIEGILNGLGILAAIFSVGWLAIWIWDNPQRALNLALKYLADIANWLLDHPNFTAYVLLILICIALAYAFIFIGAAWLWLRRKAGRENAET